MFLNPDKEDLYIGFDIETLPITDTEPYPEPMSFSTYRYIDITEETKTTYHYENVRQELQNLHDFCKKHGAVLVGHNLSYDFTCIKNHLGIDFFKLDYEDTMVLAWLVNPELNPKFGELKLKWLSEKWCKIKPEEQLDINNWLWENQSSFYKKYLDKTSKGKPFFNLEPKDSKTKTKGDLQKRKPNWSSWGAFLCEAPLELLKPYAIGDSYRAHALFMYIMKRTHLKNENIGEGLHDTYLKELRIQELFARRTSKGLRMDIKEMKKDDKIIKGWTDTLWKDISEQLEIDAISIKQLIPALISKGVVKDESCFKLRTKTGQISITAEALEIASDHIIVKDIVLYKRLGKFRSTYITNWLLRMNGDRLHMGFFTLLNTGRISAGNLGNTPKRKAAEVLECSEKYKHMVAPKIRKYILPDSDKHTMVVLDYMAQEIRQLAHFLPSTSRLPMEFNADPLVDIHQRTVDIFAENFNLQMERGDSKDINFGIVYGLGLKGLAAKMGRSLAEATKFLAKYYETFKGVKSLIDKVRAIVEGGGFIRTIGKRKFYLRETRSYKYMNYLIQGSSSDQTKSALVKHGTIITEKIVFVQGEHIKVKEYKTDSDYCDDLMFPLHDEGVFSVPTNRLESSIEYTKECMENCGIKTKVPFRMDVEVREKNYAA